MCALAMCVGSGECGGGGVLCARKVDKVVRSQSYYLKATIDSHRPFNPSLSLSFSLSQAIRVMHSLRERGTHTAKGMPRGPQSHSTQTNSPKNQPHK